MESKILTLSFLLLSLASKASDKAHEKISALYKKGKFYKCYTKSTDARKKKGKGNDPFLLYFLSFSGAKLKKDELKKLSLRDEIALSLKWLKLAYNKDKNETNFKQFNVQTQELKIIYIHQADSLFGKKKNLLAKVYYEALAHIFKDTLSNYWTYHPKAIVIEQIDKAKLSAEKALLAKRDSIVEYAKSFIGVPYLYGGLSRKGIDCSGFTLTVMKQFNIQLSHVAGDQSIVCNINDDFKKGDLAFFGTRSKSGKISISHVALIISNADEGLQVIHATSSKGVIINEIIGDKYWEPKLLFTGSIFKEQLN